MSLDDIRHYCRIVTSLQDTMEIQKVIDIICPEVEEETLELGLSGEQREGMTSFWTILLETIFEPRRSENEDLTFSRRR